MDPQQTLNIAGIEITNHNYDDAMEYLDSYREWRDRGGFEPINGDKQYDRMMQRIATAAHLRIISMSRREIEDVLRSVDIECGDDESINMLRLALSENVKDGTIRFDRLPDTYHA
jgi:hypothetical protein